MKRWEKAIAHKWRSKTSHAFLLYLNVEDDFLNDVGEFEKLPDYLVSGTAIGKAHFVATFNRGTGIRFARGQEFEFLAFLEALKPELNPLTGKNAAVEEFFAFRNSIPYALELFGEMLAMPLASVKDRLLEKADDQAFFSVIFEYAETLAPPESATTTNEPDRNAMVGFLTLARSKAIQEAGNLFVMLTESLGLIAPSLKSETNGIVPLKLGFPDREDREATISALRMDYPALPHDIDPTDFAHITAGMSRNVIGNLIKESREKKEPISTETVFKKKKKFIEEQSNGLLEIMQPLWGIEAIGGLHEHKRYIREVVATMKKNDFLATPMGIMLLGAPGTGKTVFAQAVAREADIPFVKMKTIRSMWMGQSERNLDFALELIRAQAPVVVFVDEIDQQYQQRSDGPNGDSGVSNRIQGRLFEFMSDTDMRGEVLWIAASNRPDLLDAAMLREGRFDEKIPFFPPNAEERGEILEAILMKMKAQAGARKKEFHWDIPQEYFAEFGWKSHLHAKHGNGIVGCTAETHPYGEEADDELQFTGSEIEDIVRKATTLASSRNETLRPTHLNKVLEEHIPIHNIALYGLMTELAIRQCNSERFIPEGYWRTRARQLRSERPGGDTTVKS